MKIKIALIALMPLALSACGIPDIVAHGVKSYEKSQDAKDAQTQPATAQTQQPQTQQPPPPASYAPPPVAAPAPPRESVTVEKLQ